MTTASPVGASAELGGTRASSARPAAREDRAAHADRRARNDRVRRVDDRVDVERGDVAVDGVELHPVGVCPQSEAVIAGISQVPLAFPLALAAKITPM